MPIYEYACKQCEHRLDALQKISDEPLTECPACGEPQLRRLLSAPRFRLKGSGWYETDFKTENKRNLAGDKDPNKKDDKPKGDKDKPASGDAGSGKKAAAADTKTS